MAGETFKSDRSRWFRSLGSLIVVLIIILVLVVPGQLLAKRNVLRSQSLRDAEAHAPGPKALFLRSFFTDKKVHLLSPFFSRWAAAGGTEVRPPVLLPEEFVGRVLEPYINVVEIKGRDKTIAPGQITTTDVEWKTTVARTIPSASVVVILPAMGKKKRKDEERGHGTVWELEHLMRSGYMDRTIAIMPVTIWVRRRSVRQSWERIRQEMSDKGLVLPEYNRRGSVITFELKDNVWRPARIFGQTGSSRKRLAIGLVEAVEWEARIHKFELLSR